MSCQTCMQLPKDAYARFVTKVRTLKIIRQSDVRVVYMNSIDGEIYTLRIDGADPPRKKGETSYFELESGDKILSLVARDETEIVSDSFEFKPDLHYTLIVFQDHILQFEEEDLRCPDPGTVRLQAYNMDGKAMNIYLDEQILFEKLGNDQFVETLVYPGIYVLRMSVDKEFSTELEVRSGAIYTLFFLFEAMAMFVVENDQCLNPV